ncbi:MAG TPA: hypothetical protein VMW94_04015 [Actinomycetes bacterium]|nr:hypothetical protein [Actinomycetes bacterium]
MIARAATKRTNASQDYAVLRQEAWLLVDRIMQTLLDDSEPEGVNWGHVGDMAATRDELRWISDRIFTEGEYAA